MMSVADLYRTSACVDDTSDSDDDDDIPMKNTSFLPGVQRPDGKAWHHVYGQFLDDTTQTTQNLWNNTQQSFGLGRKENNMHHVGHASDEPASPPISFRSSYHSAASTENAEVETPRQQQQRKTLRQRLFGSSSSKQRMQDTINQLQENEEKNKQIIRNLQQENSQLRAVLERQPDRQSGISFNFLPQHHVDHSTHNTTQNQNKSSKGPHIKVSEGFAGRALSSPHLVKMLP